MQAFVIIDSVGMMINAGVNSKNQLTKVHVIKDLFGILVTVSVNVGKSCDVGEYLDYENWRCRKKLVEECTENAGEEKLAKVALAEDENKHKCSSCTPAHCFVFNNFYN